jgi:predicted lipoprotein with Yx(FWY)xxD motif
MQTKVIAGSLAVAAILAGGAAAAATGSGQASKTTAVVKTGHALGENVLVTRSGLTLYSLSAEKGGRFICTNSSCLALWHPLTVAKGTKPSGAAHLATIRRPGGKMQVTFERKPLYTFVQDKRPGQAKGEGFKDVGTWHVATTSSTKHATPAPQTMPGYGGY